MLGNLQDPQFLLHRSINGQIASPVSRMLSSRVLVTDMLLRPHRTTDEKVAMASWICFGRRGLHSPMVLETKAQVLCQTFIERIKTFCAGQAHLPIFLLVPHKRLRILCIVVSVHKIDRLPVEERTSAWTQSQTTTGKRIPPNQ